LATDITAQDIHHNCAVKFDLRAILIDAYDIQVQWLILAPQFVQYFRKWKRPRSNGYVRCLIAKAKNQLILEEDIRRVLRTGTVRGNAPPRGQRPSSEWDFQAWPEQRSHCPVHNYKGRCDCEECRRGPPNSERPNATLRASPTGYSFARIYFSNRHDPMHQAKGSFAMSQPVQVAELVGNDVFESGSEECRAGTANAVGGNNHDIFPSIREGEERIQFWNNKVVVRDHKNPSGWANIPRKFHKLVNEYAALPVKHLLVGRMSFRQLG
jgi:hypothetical protein